MTPMSPPPLGPTIHANALMIDAVAVIIRGRAGAGKSALTLDLLDTLREAGRFAALIGDDRVIVSARSGRLVVQAPPIIAGRIERRGAGIEDVRHEPAGLVALVVDLVDSSIDRLPEPSDLTAEIDGIRVPRLCLAEGGAPRSRDVLAVLDRLTGKPFGRQNGR